MSIGTTVGYLKNSLNLDKFKKLYYFDNGKKKSLDIGAFQEQKFNLSNTITDNPVEYGANLSDTIYRNPDIISVAIIVGDTDGVVQSVVSNVKNVISGFSDGIISGLSSSILNFTDSSATGNLKSSKVYNEIIRIKENFLPLEIVTRDRIYNNLQIKDIERVITFDNYGGAVILVNLKNLLTFNTEASNSLSDIKKNNGFISVKEIPSAILGSFGL